MHITENLNVREFDPIEPPSSLKARYPLAETAQDFIFESRQTVQNILTGKDNRLFVVVGPCSIHDPVQALEYAKKLKQLADAVKDKLFLIMRVYFEKPRTTVGWKGLINDPHLNDTFDVQLGLETARKLMLDITSIGLPIGTEALDPITPQYLADLVTWSAIGARTTESQTHREMASGLSSPVGFKNGTDGNIEVSVNAILSAARPHRFLGIDESGCVALVATGGNAFGHIILRGGSSGPNYDAVSIEEARDALLKANVSTAVVVDCSHGNSNKNYSLQPKVFKAVVQEKMLGLDCIKGLMLESFLQEGNQKLDPKRPDLLKAGVSITDACISWDQTEKVLLDVYSML